MHKSYRVGWGGVVVAHKISVSAPVPLEQILTGFDWVGAGPWGFGILGRGLTIQDFEKKRKFNGIWFEIAEQF